MINTKIKITIIAFVVIAIVLTITLTVVFSSKDHELADSTEVNELENNQNNTQTETSQREYVLLDLGGKGCIPCDNLQPVLASLREQYEHIDIIFYDVNRSDMGQELANKYRIQYIPTLIFIEDGVEVKRIVGFRTEEQLEEIFRDLGWIE